MKRPGAALLAAALLCILAYPARADQAEVREIARNNSCPPKKIDIFQQTLGEEGQTIYRVECTLPKMADGSSNGPDALLISCHDSLCELLRPYEEPKK